MNRLEVELERRILILDGAMGTMIQKYKLLEIDYRNKQLDHQSIELKGNTDLLNLTRQDVIAEIHEQYLAAGADIISTNTFGANAISQADYGTSEFVSEINFTGAQLAKQAALKFSVLNPQKPRFVAGAIGPTTKLASLSPTVTDPAFRAVSFDQLVEAYIEQAKALIAGGVDLFLLETITDTLNAKAALFALMQLFEETGAKYPIMVSATITDASGRILSGQTIEAFLNSVSHAPLLSVGLNCALGASELRPYIQTLDKISPFYVSTHPNAGLPNQFGGYDQAPGQLASLIYEFAQNGWLNIVGGCCGTTPDHIAALSKAVKGLYLRQKPGIKNQTNKPAATSQELKDLVEDWAVNESVNNQPAFTLSQLMKIISEVEDEKTFRVIQEKFNAERSLDHPEQAMLLNAHLFGRYQYLRMENKVETL